MNYKKMALTVQIIEKVTLLLLITGSILPCCNGYTNKKEDKETGTYILTVKRRQREEPYVYRPRFSGITGKRSIKNDILLENGNNAYDELRLSTNEEILKKPIVVLVDDFEGDKKSENGNKRQVSMWGRRQRFHNQHPIHHSSTDIDIQPAKTQQVIGYPKNMKTHNSNRRLFFGEFDTKRSPMRKPVFMRRRFSDPNDEEDMIDLDGNKDVYYKMSERSVHPKFRQMKRISSKYGSKNYMINNNKDLLEDEKLYDESLDKNDLLLQQQQDLDGLADYMYVSDENMPDQEDSSENDRSTTVLDDHKQYDYNSDVHGDDLRNKKLKTPIVEQDIKVYIIKKKV